VNKRFLVVFSLLLIFTTSAFALTWKQAVELLDEKSDSLKSAQKQLESAEWSYKKSLTVFFPQLSASAGLSENLVATNSATAKTYSYGLSATQSLFNGMDNIYGVQSANLNVEYYKANLDSTYANVYYNLRSDFLDLLFSQKKVVLYEKILKHRQDNAELIQLRYQSGREDKGNLMGTKSDEKQAEYNLNNVKRQLKLARLRLAQKLQIAINEIEEEFNIDLPEKVNYDQLMLKTPDYTLAKTQLETARISQRTAISEFLPTVSLSASYNRRGQNWPPDSVSSKSWSLNCSYALFRGGGSIADKIIADIALDQAREDFDSSVKDLRYNLQKSYEDFVDAIEALEVSRVALEAQIEKAQIAGVKYMSGLMNYDDWDKAENNYIKAQKSLLDAQKTALLAEANWHKNYGGKK